MKIKSIIFIFLSKNNKSRRHLDTSLDHCERFDFRYKTANSRQTWTTNDDQNSASSSSWLSDDVSEKNSFHYFIGKFYNLPIAMIDNSSSRHKLFSPRDFEWLSFYFCNIYSLWWRILLFLMVETCETISK